MSDVREQMFTAIQARFRREGWSFMPEAATASVDAILERFDVTAKPVVTDEQLGIYVAQAYPNYGFAYVKAGSELRKQLKAAGLQIVKVDE